MYICADSLLLRYNRILKTKLSKSSLMLFKVNSYLVTISPEVNVSFPYSTVLWLLMHCASHSAEPLHSPISANNATSSRDLAVCTQTQGPGCCPWVWGCTLPDHHLHSPPSLQKHTLSFSFYSASPLPLLVPPSFQFWTPTCNFFLLSEEKFHFLKHWALEIQAKTDFSSARRGRTIQIIGFTA